MSTKDNPVTSCQILGAVALVSFVLVLMMAFQTVQIVRDREFLNQAKSQQDKPLEDSRKVQAQVTALAMGAKKLADGGDKNAAAIIDRLQQIGITVGGPPPAAPGVAGAAPPAATPPAAPTPPAKP
jgi:hypothetical protein